MSVAGATRDPGLDRSAIIRDPHGHIWVLLTHLEDVDPDTMTQRGEALLRST